MEVTIARPGTAWAFGGRERRLPGPPPPPGTGEIWEVEGHARSSTALRDPPEGGQKGYGRCQDPPSVNQDEDAPGTFGVLAGGRRGREKEGGEKLRSGTRETPEKQTRLRISQSHPVGAWN